jgi:hypothetical protein
MAAGTLASRMNRSTLALLLLALAASRPAHAADAHDEARQRYQQGVAAFEKGDFANAVDAFGAVYATTHETKHLWNLALAEYKANRTFDALAHLREYVAKTDANPKNVERAQGLISEESGKIAHLTIVAPSGADVVMDNARVGAAPLASPVEADPDKAHVIVASKGREEVTQNLAAPGPKDVRIELAFPVAPLPVAPVVPAVLPPAASDGTPAPASSETSSGGHSGLRTWLTVGLGVGAVAAAGVGVLMGVDSSKSATNASTLRSGMQPGACTNPNATNCALLQSDLNSQQSQHTASIIFYSAAGVLAAGALASWLFVPHGDTASTAPHSTVAPVFGANFLGASYAGSF